MSSELEDTQRYACPYCDAEITLTPVKRQIRKHFHNDGVCPGSGMRYESRSNPIQRRHHLKKAARWAYALIFTVMAGATGILGWLGFSPATLGSDTTPRAKEQAPYPYSYVSTNPAQSPINLQDCRGLLGLCLGQPISVAFAAFGSNELAGFPQTNWLRADVTCHAWVPRGIGGFYACERNAPEFPPHEIVSLALTIPSGAPFAVSLPEGLELQSPVSISSFGLLATKKMDLPPYAVRAIDGEGYWLTGSYWHFIDAAEGLPGATLEISGNRAWDGASINHLPSGCDFAEFDDFTKNVNVDLVSIYSVYMDQQKTCPSRL